jgi:hypothetical protein
MKGRAKSASFVPSLLSDLGPFLGAQAIAVHFLVPPEALEPIRFEVLQF